MTVFITIAKTACVAHGCNICTTAVALPACSTSSFANDTVCCTLLQAAIALDSRNPLARFELAGVLMAQERLQEALRELQELAVSD